MKFKEISELKLRFKPRIIFKFEIKKDFKKACFIKKPITWRSNFNKELVYINCLLLYV
jgi:hypothetical protein